MRTARGETRAPTAYAYKEVPPTALKGHLKHGDAETGCSAVAVGECQALGCDASGACVAVADPDLVGEPCGEDGAGTTCRADGSCTVTPTQG